MSKSAASTASASLADRSIPAHLELLELVHHAAHLLPSQGPITVFVHHNTLHALEQLPFSEALRQSIDVYGYEPYLDEARYRREFASGRIRLDDLRDALLEDLGDRGDELIGLLGTRFHFRLAMLQYPIRTAPAAELRWIVAETEALQKYRPDAPFDVRKQAVEATHKWVKKNLRDKKRPDAECDSQFAALVAGIDCEALDAYLDADWEKLTLSLLWKLCSIGAGDFQGSPRTSNASHRLRDQLFAATDFDPDVLVHDLLIRVTSAFLDQGFSPWALPARKEGLWRAFLQLYGQPGGVLPSWLAPLRKELRRLRDADVDPLESIEESLSLLGVQPPEREEFIVQSLLALRGWAGMIWQMETNAEWAVRPAPAGTLVEFLAVRLLLDRTAAAFVAREHLDYRGPLAGLSAALDDRQPQAPAEGAVQKAFTVFQLAQILGWNAHDMSQLSADDWKRLIDEIEAFSSLDRRRVFHLAYERTYRTKALNALAEFAARRSPRPPSKSAPAFQIICCIDDREESFRRHLEEFDNDCETFGYAGFFGVAMYYQGLGDAHNRPLCPVVIKPRHYVVETPAFNFQHLSERRAKTRRAIGAASHHVHRGSRSLLGGTATALLGSLASIPMVARILLPRVTAQVRQAFNRFVQPPEVTQLALERTEAQPGPEEGHVGYSVEEMAVIVERTLRDIGLTANFARLILTCGHGSSSLNNPHESAYNCGACSGGRGGPNARAFAQMANDPRVRRLLSLRGLEIPPESYFLGAYHNTCDEQVDYFDLDRLPTTFQPLFVRVRRSIDAARQQNAHERCRRFESVDLHVNPEAALRSVQERAEDLSQARPEYNHATNAMCVVGRRSLTRGLYLDRRSFLASYDPTQDDDQATILGRILQAVIPVCAGISLEYYFSTVDVQGYGCGSKLPHNITSLLGVMEGAASDLRTGLSAQMTEIHEPMRILFVIESTPAAMQQVIDGSAVIRQLCFNEWVQLAVISPAGDRIHLYSPQGFTEYHPSSSDLPEVLASNDWYRGWRDHLGIALIRSREHHSAVPRSSIAAAN